ncbi:serine/arginine repetitive matrix protein 1 isoform X1 [Alosa alosa]|uniref:serine/arginine repetitive matrix protein 1 isoform X1 n=1 Tax=Alosa alosa TaxID=278164 RepID=UPI00201529D1|nr:serine/arginine repetitive matrix protein 1 isoform X1 [Alosa alosa]
MVRPRTGSPRMKHRSYMSDFGSQNGGEHPRPFRSGRGGGPGKAPPSWREAPNRGRKAPYPDRQSAPWQQKSPQGRDRGQSSWQTKSQESYMGYASQPSDSHRHYGDPANRPGPAQRRPSPHEPASGRSHHRQYDGGPRRFESRPPIPDHRSHKQVHPQPPHHRSPFRPPTRQEERPWGRSQSPSYPSRPPPKPQHVSQAGDRGRGRGRGRRGRGSGNGCGRETFWSERGPDRSHPYTSTRPHHPQPRNGEGRCPSDSPLRKEREFHSRERYQSPQVVVQAGWSSSTGRDCNERRSRERERMGSGRHGNEPEHWPPPNPSQYRPPPHTPSWKAGPPPGPHPSKLSAARRFQSHQTPRGPDRGSSGYKRKYPEMLEQPRPPPPLFRHFRRDPSVAPPLRGFGGRGLSLRDKSRLMKNRKFREESVARFKTMPPPPPAIRGRPAPLQNRMAYRPFPRQQTTEHHEAAPARKFPKRSSPSRKASSDHSPDPENPVSDGDQDQPRSPQYRRSSSRHSPIPLDQHLPSDLVVVSHWQAENDGDCDDQGDAKETSDIQSDLISGPQEPPPEATAPAQDQSLQNKRLVRRPLMSLKTIRPLRKFGQLQAIVATRRSHSIVSKYRLLRQRAPPVPVPPPAPAPAPVSQTQQSTSHRRW